MSDAVVRDSAEFPLKEYLGFSAEASDGVGVARLELTEQHHNPNGVAHGAVAFTLMDTAMGAAVMSVIEEGNVCATIEMHTRFIRGAGEGSLIAEARVTHPGRRIVHLEADTRDGDGRLIATATSSYAVIQPG